MPYYETVFIARQELTPSQVEEMTTAFSKILKDNGGKIVKTENWGLRTLAYRINKARKGHYVLIESESPGAAVIELERNMRFNEDVLRFISVRLEGASKGPSAIMDKGGRDDESTTPNEKEAA